MPELISKRLDMYIIADYVISMACLRDPSLQYYHSTGSQVVEVMPLMLLEFLN
jgi:hypothetical protein